MDSSYSGGLEGLHEFFRILRRQTWVVLLALGIAIASALTYSYLARPTYSATATVLVPQEQAAGVLNSQSSQLQDAGNLQRYLSDQEQFAQGDAVATVASTKLGYRAKVNIGTSTTSDILTFSATSNSARTASDIANAYAEAYISASRSTRAEQYAQQVTALESSISNLKQKEAALSPNDPQHVPLQQSIDALTQSVEQSQAASQLTDQVGPSIVTAAKIPTVPVAPKRVLDLTLGALVGLALGIGFAIIRERLDDAISSREIAERVAGKSPILGSLPYVDTWSNQGAAHLALMEDPNSPVSESYRTLRTSLDFLRLQKSQQIIAVTSSISGEGKSTVIANLAVSLANAGRRVAVVSADLRRPHIHDFFSLPNSIGLTSVLLGDVMLDDAIATVAEEPLLTILPAGPTPPNPAEILGMQATKEVVGKLARHVDVVLLDCPPVLPVADALVISQFADAVVVLAAVGKTGRRQLSRTLELLDQVQAPIDGILLNQVPQSDLGGYYGYGAAYRYRPDSGVAGDVPRPSKAASAYGMVGRNLDS